MAATRLIVVALAILATAATLRGQEAGDLELTPRTLSTASGMTFAAEMGSLYVPENRDDPDTRLIRLAFVRVKSPAAAPRAPVVYLAGGPGGSATPIPLHEDGLAGFAPMLDVCDVIFLDQRGTGSSEPDMTVAPPGDMHEHVFRDRDAAVEAARTASAAAVTALRERGIDLAGYTTVQSADDIEDLRRALGLRRISLLGFSYGTHLEQAVIKRHGHVVECAILCGVEGLDETVKLAAYADVQFEKIARLAAADPVIGEQVPDLTALLRRVLDKLADEPMVIAAQHPATGDPIEVPVGPFGLLLILRFDLGDASDIPVFPRLLHSIDQGDPRVLAWFVRKRLNMLNGLSGMTYLMDAASGASPERRTLVDAQTRTALFGPVVNFPVDDARDIWNAPDLGPSFRSPIVSDVRTLLLSGTLDWNTPPFQAERLRFGLTNASHVIVENAGHEQILSHPKVQAAILTFVRGEPVPTATIRAQPPRFVPLEGSDPAVAHPAVPR